MSNIFVPHLQQISGVFDERGIAYLEVNKHRTRFILNVVGTVRIWIGTNPNEDFNTWFTVTDDISDFEYGVYGPIWLQANQGTVLSASSSVEEEVIFRPLDGDFEGYLHEFTVGDENGHITTGEFAHLRNSTADVPDYEGTTQNVLVDVPAMQGSRWDGAIWHDEGYSEGINLQDALLTVGEEATFLHANLADMGLAPVTGESSGQLVFVTRAIWEELPSGLMFCVLREETDGGISSNNRAIDIAKSGGGVNSPIRIRYTMNGVDEVELQVLPVNRQPGDTIDIRWRTGLNGETKLWLVMDGITDESDTIVTPQPGLTQAAIGYAPSSSLRNNNIRVISYRLIDEALSDVEILSWPVPETGPIILTGDYGYDDYRPGPGALTNRLVDASAATWIVSNSGVDEPDHDEGNHCSDGDNPVNRYPIRAEESPNWTWRFGHIFSDVPRDTEWRPTYCNSAAIAFHDCPNAHIYRMVFDGAWDAIRPGLGSQDFLIEECWIKSCRDDAIENEDMNQGTVRNCLFDDAFVGISLAGTGGAENDLIMEGMLLGMGLHSYSPEDDGGITPPIITHGHAFKSDHDEFMARSVFVDCTIRYQVETFHGDQRWQNVIDVMDDGASSNNLLIWQSNDPLPELFEDLPIDHPSWTILEGAVAGEAEWDLRVAAFHAEFGPYPDPENEAE